MAIVRFMLVNSHAGPDDFEKMSNFEQTSCVLTARPRQRSNQPSGLAPPQVTPLMARSLNLSQLTLRDKIREAARRTHDLNEHLEQSFVPKVHQLRKLTRPPQPGSDLVTVADTSIRNQAAIMLDSEKYTVGLDDEVTALYVSIAADVEQVLNEKPPR